MNWGQGAQFSHNRKSINEVTLALVTHLLCRRAKSNSRIHAFGHMPYCFPKKLIPWESQEERHYTSIRNEFCVCVCTCVCVRVEKKNRLFRCDAHSPMSLRMRRTYFPGHVRETTQFVGSPQPLQGWSGPLNSVSENVFLDPVLFDD